MALGLRYEVDVFLTGLDVSCDWVSGQKISGIVLSGTVCDRHIMGLHSKGPACDPVGWLRLTDLNQGVVVGNNYK